MDNLFSQVLEIFNNTRTWNNGEKVWVTKDTETGDGLYLINYSGDGVHVNNTRYSKGLLIAYLGNNNQLVLMPNFRASFISWVNMLSEYENQQRYALTARELHNSRL